MRWEFDDVVESVVSSFALCELPDAHDWEDLTYAVMPVGRADADGACWRVEADVPTSAMDAWLSFTLVLAPGQARPVVRDVSCIRNGRDDGETCYVWEGGEWSVARCARVWFTGHPF